MKQTTEGQDHIGQIEELQRRWEALQAQHGALEPQADPQKEPEPADRLDRLDRLDGDGDDIMEETLGNEDVIAEVPAVSQKETSQRKGAPQLWFGWILANVHAEEPVWDQVSADVGCVRVCSSCFCTLFPSVNCQPRKVEGTSAELQDSWQRSGQGQKMKKAREALPAFKAL